MFLTPFSTRSLLGPYPALQIVFSGNVFFADLPKQFMDHIVYNAQLQEMVPLMLL